MLEFEEMLSAIAHVAERQTALIWILPDAENVTIHTLFLQFRNGPFYETL